MTEDHRNIANDWPDPHDPYVLADPPQQLKPTLYLASALGELKKVISLVDTRNPSRDDRQHALDAAVHYDQRTVVKHFLDEGGDITTSTLTAAKTSKSLGAVDEFVKHGWDVNSNTTPVPLTAKEAAFSYNPFLRSVVSSEELVKYLLDHGADPNLAEPIVAAAVASDVAVLKLLVSRGANLDGCYPVHAAARASAKGGRQPVIEYLLDLGADVNAIDDEGDTPLHSAMNAGQNADERRKTIQVLLNRGADPTIEDTGGKRPISYTTWYGEDGVAALLEEKAKQYAK